MWLKATKAGGDSQLVARCLLIRPLGAYDGSVSETSGHAWDVMGTAGTEKGASDDRGHGGAAGDVVAVGDVAGQLPEHLGEVGEGVAPELEVQGTPNAVEVAEAWLAELADQVSVPASEVQDHLLDLWGALDEGSARVEVERWLTETLGRNLYAVADINERLDELLASR